MRRLHLLTAALALVFVACASEGDGGAATTGGGQGSTTQSSDSGTSAAPDSTAAAAPATTTTTAPGVTETTSGRPSAPDFSLELGDGGTYTLSEGAKPVYLIFWAEW